MTVKELQHLFELHADGSNAEKMAAYMKNHFIFFGIPKTVRVEISKPFLLAHFKKDWPVLLPILKDLWEKPEREFHYTAMELMRKSKCWKHKESIRFFEKCILSHTWWDSVDAIAAHMVGGYFSCYPEQRNQYIEKWMQSDSFWLQRTCLLFQLNYKERTDSGLLFACIVPLLHSKEFFIQKAIGWALRQYARINPDVVLAFVDSHPLKPLSRREALKHFS
ncbi:MAG: DNA alkylation repair protein [Bacteroidetes bacterium]|nr:DNA alkylation repair protein [Bacteroidota bacterium]